MDVVFASSKSNGAVSAIDGSSNEKIGSITVGKQINQIAVNQITNRIYVSSVGDCDPSSNNDQTISVVCVIDYSTNYENYMHPIVFNETNGNIRLDGNVNDISVNPLTNTIYVSKVSSDKIDVINGSNNQIISNITVENQPTKSLLIHSQTRYTYRRIPQIK